MANNDDSSIFYKALIGAPIAGGVYAAGSKFRESPNTYAQAVTSISPPSEIVKDFAQQYSVPSPSSDFKARQIDVLSDLSDNPSLSAEQIRRSFNRAVSVAEPGGRLAAALDKRLSSATTAQSMYKDIAHLALTSDSIYLSRAMNLFLDDISMLEPRAALGMNTNLASFSGSVPRVFENLTLGDLSSKMQSDIGRMENLLGATAKLTRVSRHDIPGSELWVKFPHTDRTPDFTMRVAQEGAQSGVIVRGTTQQSRYIAGTYGLLENGVLTESFKHDEFMLRRAAEELIPDMLNSRNRTDRELRAMVSAFGQSVMEAPEWTYSVKPGLHAGLEEYTDVRSQIRRLYTRGDQGGFRPINELEQARIMERGLPTASGKTLDVFPGYSPSQIAHGVVSDVDLRSGQALMPSTSSYGRRPGQFLRAGYTPTTSAMDAMAASEINKFYEPFNASMGVNSPMERVAYVSPSLDDQLAGTGVSSEGQFIRSSQRAAERAQSRVMQLDIASNQGMMDLANYVDPKGAAYQGIGQVAPKGTFLGYSPSGELVQLERDTYLAHMTAFEKDAAKGDFMRVVGTQDITDLPQAKVFGGLKGMGKDVSQSLIGATLRNVIDSDDRVRQLYEHIDVVGTADDLKKARHLHYNQMFTSLWDFTRQNMDAGLIQASSYAADPRSIIAGIEKESLNAGKFNHQHALNRIIGLARESKLDPTQMGYVFGAVPDIFGIEAMGSISPVERARISQGVATGATQLYFEGLTGPGSGKMATIEPRAFELLDAPHLGQVGPSLKEDMARRMMAAYPEKVSEQGLLQRAMTSFGKTASGEVMSLADIRSGLPLRSSTVDVPGIGGVFVPGSEEMRGMSSYTTPTGNVMESPLAARYQDLFDTAERYEAGQAHKGMLQASADKLRGELANAYVGTVSGTGGLLRNRVPGSMFLTAMQPTLATERIASGAVGITAPYAEKMFASMRRLGIYGEGEMKQLRRKFMSGNVIEGTIGRHPYIGPYSTQATGFQLVAGDQPVALFNERMQNAVTQAGRMKGDALAAFEQNAAKALEGNAYLRDVRAKQMGAEALSSPIRLSPLVGMAGDFDGDIVSAMFAGPQLQKNLAMHRAAPDAMRLYEEYSIRSQVLKAKAASGDVTLRKLMAGDVIKLGITEGGRLGKLSMGLQKYRASVLSPASGLSNAERMNALGLLEWMEQTPISGKHIAAGQEENMIRMLDNIQVAIETKNANGIADAARVVLAKAKQSGKAALNEGFTIAMEDIGAPGGVTTRFIPSIDLHKASQNLGTARASWEATSAGKQSAARMREMLMSRGGKLSPKDLDSLFRREALASSPFGGLLPDIPTSNAFSARAGRFGSTVANKMSTIQNRLAAAGKSMIPLAKPVALGGAVALGLATVLSGPPRVLEPGAHVPPPMPRGGGTGGENIGTQVHPDSHVGGQPTASNPVNAAGQARITSGERPGLRATINATTYGGVDENGLANGVRGVAGSRANVNMRITDGRQSLTAQRLSSILRDE